MGTTLSIAPLFNSKCNIIFLTQKKEKLKTNESIQKFNILNLISLNSRSLGNPMFGIFFPNNDSIFPFKSTFLYVLVDVVEIGWKHLDEPIRKN